MRVLVMWLVAMGLAAGTPALGDEGRGKNTAAANEATPAPTKSAESPSPLATRAGLEIELEQMKALLEEQRAALERQQKRLEALEGRLKGARAGVRANANSAPSSTPAATASTAAPGVRGHLRGDGEETRKRPLSFKIGTADFTPGGFLDFTTIFRSTNVGSGIGTSFGSIPFNNSAQGRLAESRFTAQNSRVSLKVDAKAGAQDVTGYVEADFLGFQPANGFVTSNSNSLRMRLYWVDVKRGRWEVLGGQSWSFLTPNRVGLSPMPADIFITQDMDTNYQVGLTWARQAQFRVIFHPNRNWAFGVSLENPQQFVPPSVAFPSSSFVSQFDGGSNAAAPNLHPDIIVKTAFDGHLGGRAMHAEIAGLLRSFKVFNPLATPGGTDTITGGGGSINVNLELIRNFRFIATSFYSYGGGRYIFGLGPDVIVRPDGRLSGVHSGSGIAGFEYQATPAWLMYGYYGGAYFQRNVGIVGSGTSRSFVGFGFPGSPNTANRSVQEGTFGFVHTFWKNPDYGALQVITQYSYLTRSPWSVPPGSPKNAHASMGYVNLRYVLP